MVSRSGAPAAICSTPAAREASRPRCKSAASSIPTTASSMLCRRRPRTVGHLRRRDEPPSDCSPGRLEENGCRFAVDDRSTPMNATLESNHPRRPGESADQDLSAQFHELFDGVEDLIKRVAEVESPEIQKI